MLNGWNRKMRNRNGGDHRTGIRRIRITTAFHSMDRGDGRIAS